jgi:hypothetical protein
MGESFATKLYYQDGMASNNATAQFFFDTDFNPLNGNDVSIMAVSLPMTGANFVACGTMDLTATNIAPGIYSIYGKVSDGTHIRYLYAPELVEVVVSRQPPMVGILELLGSKLVSINGIPGQTVVLQSSTDLSAWIPVATNSLASGRWDYVVPTAPNRSHEFYRAVLAP